MLDATPNRELLVNNITNQTTDIVNGVMTVEINTAVSQEGWGIKAARDATNSKDLMENAITSKINTVFNVTSPQQIADHVVYCLPDHGPAGFTAYAYVKSLNSVYNNKYCNYFSVQMHEVRLSWIWSAPIVF